MILDPGEKVHIVIRRSFKDDLRRHFVGEVLAVSLNTVRVEGFVLIYDTITSEYVRRPNRRIQLFSLLDAGNMITVLPPETVILNIQYKMSKDRHLVVTDDVGFILDINEFCARY